jgi:hypothetical protein
MAGKAGTMIRIVLLMIGSALLLAYGRAEVLHAWYLDGNAVTDLEEETGQSTGGVGLQVGWRDTTIRVYDPDTPFGADELVAQQHRQSLDIHNHILLSFDNLFGTDNLQIVLRSRLFDGIG